MNLVNIQTAKHQLSKLIKETLAGKEIIIGEAGVPLVEFLPYSKKLFLDKPDN